MVTYSELIQFVIMLTEIITLYFLAQNKRNTAQLYQSYGVSFTLFLVRTAYCEYPPYCLYYNL